jgi:hypothetical protein
MAKNTNSKQGGTRMKHSIRQDLQDYQDFFGLVYLYPVHPVDPVRKGTKQPTRDPACAGANR